VHRVGKHRLERAGPVEQALVAIKVERGVGGGDAERMAGIGEAVGKLGYMIGALHEGIMDLSAHQHATKGRGAVGHALGEADHVGHDLVALGGKRVAEPAEAGDDLIEDQQDAVGAGDLAQALKIALGAGEHAGRAGHWARR